MAKNNGSPGLSEQFTLIINLTDGSELSYALNTNQKEDFEQTLRDALLSWRNPANAKFVLFGVFPKRVVYLNTGYLLKITFVDDFPALSSEFSYKDNFNVLPDSEKTEKGFAKSTEEDEALIPQLIIKLTGKVEASDVLTYDGLEKGELSVFSLDAAVQESEMQEFLELIDTDGDNNFIPVRQIVCMEGEADIFEEVR
ncbi:hypothetical protein CKK33_16880 [Mucilaginibacter sp. MD40]|uniref:hypothetical protein n=1 Tax=Mucilaginibacter sp. MD40 TaxID=2029590 RepID=UPI000BACBD65|nr:hypothetical protein [Mucilaginibacter sp. MD40]PAW95077.1 hypothetical protein CKK33_16880 [Mucilaginibacter sp. MD40]